MPEKKEVHRIGELLVNGFVGLCFVGIIICAVWLATVIL